MADSSRSLLLEHIKSVVMFRIEMTEATRKPPPWQMASSNISILYK